MWGRSSWASPSPRRSSRWARPSPISSTSRRSPPTKRSHDRSRRPTMTRRAPPFTRILLGSLVLTLPAALVLGVLVWADALPVGTAALSAAAIYAGVALLSGPLFSGLAQVRTALGALAQGATTLPDIVTLSPTARELGRDAARFARALRETVAASAEARASAESVLSALPEPLMLIDAERRILSANPSALELLGPRLAGRDLGAALRVPAVLEATDAVLAGGEGRTVEIELPGSVERHLSAQVGPLRPPTSAGAAAVLTLTDITGSKRSERMRQDFVANASHELRTPLATLLGFIETLRGPARDDNAARDRFLSIMAEQASRMSRAARGEAADADRDQLAGEPAGGRGRRRRTRPGVPEPDRQRDQIRPVRDRRGGERRRLGQAACGHARRAGRDPRSRRGHPQRAHSAADRALLPGRPRPLPGARWHRPRARDR